MSAEYCLPLLVKSDRALQRGISATAELLVMF